MLSSWKYRCRVLHQRVVKCEQVPYVLKLPRHRQSQRFINDAFCEILAVKKRHCRQLDHLRASADLHHRLKEIVVKLVMVGDIQRVVLLHVRVQVIELAHEVGRHVRALLLLDLECRVEHNLPDDIVCECQVGLSAASAVHFLDQNRQ